MLSCSESPSKSASPQANNDSTPSTSSATTVVAATPESITTTDGTYTVKFSPSPDPIPVNDFFAVRAIVYDNQGNPLTDDDIDLYVDAAMPHHGHGMNHESTVVYDNDGRFMATDLLFHMTGYWEIYFDITRDGRTERAQTSVTIE